MTTGKKQMDEVRLMDLTEEEITLLKAMRDKLPEERDREAFLKLLDESPTLIKVARFTRKSIMSYNFLKRVTLWFMGTIIAINIFSIEIGKLIAWVGQYIRG